MALYSAENACRYPHQQLRHVPWAWRLSVNRSSGKREMGEWAVHLPIVGDPASPRPATVAEQRSCSRVRWARRVRGCRQRGDLEERWLSCSCSLLLALAPRSSSPVRRSAGELETSREPERQKAESRRQRAESGPHFRVFRLFPGSSSVCKSARTWWLPTKRRPREYGVIPKTVHDQSFAL